MNPVSVGKVIAERRKALHMTQRQLAHILEINISELLDLKPEPSNKMDEVLKAAVKISDEEHKHIKKTIKNNLLCFAVLGFVILAGAICLELTSVMDIDNEQWTTIRDLIWGFMRFSFFVIPLWAVRSLIMFKRL